MDKQQYEDQTNFFDNHQFFYSCNGIVRHIQDFQRWKLTGKQLQ